MEIDRPDVKGALLGSNMTLVSGQVDITSEATLWFTSVVFRVSIIPGLSVFGLVTNIINVIVFSRMNLKEGASATFLVLSIMDGMVCFIGVVFSVFSILKYLGPARLVRSVNGLWTIAVAASLFPRWASIFANLVIAVVRCCSVAMPLRVKSILAVRRQLVLILLLILIYVAVQAYCMTMYKYIIVRDPQTNWTHIILILNPGFVKKVQVSDQFNMVLFYACFIVINICVVVLSVALRQSSQFRTKVARNDETRDSAGDKSKSKNRQVVKTVIMVSLVFTISNLPGIALAILRQTLPGFRTLGYLYRSFDIVFTFAEAFGMAGSAINIFIYLYSNSSYRTIFDTTCIIGSNRKKTLK